ncbi:hypothetical protein F5Y09DRAFT_353359 [Xylaria sp. FL1042]|nr:hypothetical protein F5Y09DRAFT_353359 [Xylaria sp. FL1042]
MPTTSNALPETLAEWHAIAKQRGLQLESIHGEQLYGATYKSASTIEFDQFLLLRQQQQQQPTQDSLSSLGLFALVRYYQLETEKEHEKNGLWRPKIDLSPIAGRTRSRRAALAWPSWPPQTPTRVPRVPHGGQEEADILFGDLGLDSLSSSSPEPSTPEMLETLSPALSDPDWVEAAEFKAANDEQIVNTALLLYLNALSIACSHVQGDWTLHRRQFVVKSQGKKVYEARVDGYLRSRNNEVKAIVEVKPFTRSSNHQSIKMQEAAQMAAWISVDPPDVRRMREEKKTCRYGKDTPVLFL